MTERADDDNGGGHGMTNFGVLSVRVDIIDKRLGELIAGLEKLNATLHEASKPQWVVWTGFMTVLCIMLGALWALIIIPIKDDIRDLKTASMTKEMGDEKLGQLGKQIAELQGNIKTLDVIKAGRDELGKVKRWQEK